MNDFEQNPYGGQPRRKRPGRRDPKSLDLAVQTIQASVAPATLLAAVQQVWPHVAGEAVAEQTEPVSERDAAITVACTSGAWSAELQLMSSTLLERLNRSLPEGVEAANLRFVTRSFGPN